MSASMQAGWFKVPRTVLMAGLNPFALSVYAAIASHADKDGVAFPSLNRIAQMANVSRHTVIKYVKQLESLGYLHSQRRADQRFGHCANVYRLIVPPSARDALASAHGGLALVHGVDYPSARGAPELESVEQEGLATAEMRTQNAASAIKVEPQQRAQTPEASSAPTPQPQFRASPSPPPTTAEVAAGLGIVPRQSIAAQEQAYRDLMAHPLWQAYQQAHTAQGLQVQMVTPRQAPALLEHAAAMTAMGVQPKHVDFVTRQKLQSKHGNYLFAWLRADVVPVVNAEKLSPPRVYDEVVPTPPRQAIPIETLRQIRAEASGPYAYGYSERIEQ